ncbi:MAG TPA: hypothetical protein VK456_09280 [Xanthobacteraceae bacterium]|nr:hypothetical protein [Xanthobacteraceae bacterium]
MTAPMTRDRPKLKPVIAHVRGYWNRLKRGENAIPFWDDASIAALGAFADHVLLIDVFENPLRFRIGYAGRVIVERYGAPLAGKFLDEIGLHAPLDRLNAQCVDTLTRRAPTYEHEGLPENEPVMTYARAVLPLWGRGRIEMLLGAVE